MTDASAYLPLPGDDLSIMTPAEDGDLVAVDASTGRTMDPSEVSPGSRAVIYLRVSSPGQVNTDYDPEGISIPAQRVACTRKADQLDLVVIDEYVEPGKSATEMTKRVAFQQMLARIRERKDVDVVIVYKLSRMARNRVDDAIVMADLRKRGVTLVSATESIDATPVGQLMHGILATFNEYQSRESGADISYKMGQKALSGGTLGLAPLGYLNVFDRSEGREIRTIAIDEERAPFVRLAFELYETGDYTLADLSDELYDRGLRTRPTARRPATQVSISKLSTMLRNRYYIGYITYKDEEIKGRHEPLIDEDLFGRVQDIAESRTVAGERRRVHHHYLKGSLFCGRCKAAGVTKRMIIQHTINSRGSEYTYFFCRGNQDGTCVSPHVNVTRVEYAIEDHYATIGFSPIFIADVRTHIADAIADQETAGRLLSQQLTAELRALDAKEDNLLDLAADDTLPQAKIKAKLRDIDRQRVHLTGRLNETNDELTDTAKLIELCLTLLEDPQALYRRCDDDQRRLLNRAIFKALYIEEDKVTGHDFKEPFASLRAVQDRHRASRDDKPDPGTDTTPPQNASKAASDVGGGLAATYGIEALLAGMDLVQCSSKPCYVGVVEALSSTSRPVKRLLDLATAWPNRDTYDASHIRSYRVMRQLQPADIDEMMKIYEAGATVYELAEQFSINRKTVGKHLRARGIDTKPPGLHPDDVPAAAELYRAGWSLARLAEKFDTTANTVRARLLEVGVVMRDTQGQER